MIIYNANIYSLNESIGKAESMVISGDSIVAIGSSVEIRANYTSDKLIDMKGAPVFPGFTDPHCHFYGYGTTLSEANLFETRSFDEVLDKLKKHAEKYSQGWLTGMGWDQNDWPVKEFPDHHKLDNLFPNRPVLIRRIDGHAALANSEALRLAGITGNTRVQGGEVVLKNGKPTGMLIDNAIERVKKCMPPPDKESMIRALLSAQENCFRVGLTSVHDAGLEKEIIKSIDSLQQNGKLKMRINAMLSPTEENFKEYMYRGIYRTPHLHIRSVKLYADGALGSRGAALIRPYSDDPANSGILVEDEEYLRKISQLAFDYGYQVNTHCIGDSANRLMLKIYGDILKDKNDKRWRIEHAQIIHPEDLNLFSRYSVVPSIQTTHATSDMYWAEKRLGNRIKNAYIYRSLMQQNGWLPNGSDFPIENINPLYGFYAAVSRKDQNGFPENGFQTEESLSREQALKAMTIWAAKAGFEENETGSLAPGKKADFVVLDKDIMQIPEEEIFSTKVIETWSGGEKVYSNENP